jgi:hypothetical protein
MVRPPKETATRSSSNFLTSSTAEGEGAGCLSHTNQEECRHYPSHPKQPNGVQSLGPVGWLGYTILQYVQQHVTTASNRFSAVGKRGNSLWKTACCEWAITCNRLYSHIRSERNALLCAVDGHLIGHET